MFDHVFGVSDYEKSKTFFLMSLQPLGVELVDEGSPDYGVEMSSGDVSLCLFSRMINPLRFIWPLWPRHASRLMTLPCRAARRRTRQWRTGITLLR